MEYAVDQMYQTNTTATTWRISIFAKKNFANVRKTHAYLCFVYLYFYSHFILLKQQKLYRRSNVHQAVKFWHDILTSIFKTLSLLVSKQTLPLNSHAPYTPHSTPAVYYTSPAKSTPTVCDAFESPPSHYSPPDAP